MKSNERAEVCRAEGNKFYSERNFHDALVKYNESLCYAEEESEALAIAYANRSAVYFELKLYDRCLKNIELAQSHKYPDEKRHVLNARAEKCKNFSKIPEKNSNFIKLSHKPNSRLPFVAECLELRENKIFGRYVVTNCDLNVGDVVAIETPLFKVIKSDSRYESCDERNKFKRCAVCLKDNQLDLYACTKCCSTMFCSQGCEMNGMKAFHIHECRFIEHILRSGIMQMALRVFFHSLAVFDNNIDDLMKFIAKCENQSVSVFDFDFSERVDERSCLQAAYCLVRNQKISPEDSPVSILKRDPFYEILWEPHIDFITKFMRRIIQIYDSNFHGICGFSLKKCESQEAQMIGVGCYPFASLINHSCAPNINRVYIYDKMCIIVDRPIRKGEQLFDCYQAPFFRESKSTRQMRLFEEYSFHCKCEACDKNYPLFHSLKPIDKKLSKLAKKAKNEVSKLDDTSAKEKLYEYYKMIQNLCSKNYPSPEIILLQECTLQLNSMLIKPKVLCAHSG